jgi:murein DD-endopeptidase MepM/ murein hydrolase activator NlpD
MARVMGGLCKPWPDGETIRSKYGNRRHPISGRQKKHRGVDVGYNGPIYAPADGKVVHKGVSLNKRTGGGYTLILSHSNPKVWTVYYHLREPSPLPLGKTVKQGEVIGHTGTTGASTGIHLHFETRRSQRFGTDFDPESILADCHANNVKAEPAENPKSTIPKLVEDGSLGRKTWGAVQTMLKNEGLYSGYINGVPGKSTIVGLQKYINKKNS